jgi:hypothetical protein
MSLSSPTLKNPAEHYFEWKGGDGHIEFYDREKQARVTVPLPLEFIVLDQLNGVTGWSDQNNVGIWSNETRSTKDDFTVRAGKRVLYVGPYKDEQGINQVAGFGGKYIKVVYIAHKNRNGELIIGCFGLTGAALNAWIDFTKAHSVTSGKVKLAGKTEEKKGATTYQVPVFEFTAWTDDEYNAAIKADGELQVFLGQYLTAPVERAEDHSFENEPSGDVGKATEEEILDYEARKAAKHKLNDEDDAAVTAYQDDVVNGFADDAPVSLDDIPF